MSTYRQISRNLCGGSNLDFAQPSFRRTGPCLPKNWHDRLPSPASYYQKNVEHLHCSNAQGFAQGRCPFHDDHKASLSVNVADARGGWRCFAGCGGGDLVAFHMKRTGQNFRDAVASLLRDDA